MSVLIAAPPSAEIAARVAPGEYARLLGWPRSREMETPLRERANGARAYYAAHGHPFVAARRLKIAAIGEDAVTLQDAGTLRGRALAERLRKADASALAALALSAGPEAEQAARRLWQEDKPDEGFFLERFTTAVVEELLRWSMVWVCRAAGEQGETVLFHSSPGCGSWELQEQRALMALLTPSAARLGPLRLLESGMLEPAQSLLAVLALSRRQAAPSPADACRDCDLAPCAFRRAPHRGAA